MNDSEGPHVCENGYENCWHDDWDQMSDECRESAHENYVEAMRDTYD